MRWLRSGLFRKFFVVIGALALIPSVYLAYRMASISQRGVQAAVLELHTKLAEKMAKQVDGYFRVNEDKLAYAFATLRKNMAWSDKQELLRALIDTHADIIEISILSSGGAEVIKVYNPQLASDSKLVSRAGDEGFKRFGERNARTMSISPETETMEIYYPLSDDKSDLKISARILISVAGLAREVASERVGGTGFAILVTESGEPLFYSKDRLSGALLEEVPKWELVTAALKAQSLGSKEFKSRGMTLVGSYAPVTAVRGAVLIVQPYDEAYWAALQMRRTSQVTLVVVILVVIIGATLLARNLTSPLLSLSRGAEAVSSGDFTARVAVTTGDELQDLADTFNRMTDKLREYADVQVDKLVAEQRKTEAVLYSASDGIMMTDNDGKIRLVNRRLHEFIGTDPEESLDGRTVDEVVEKERLRDAIEKSMQDPKPDAPKEVNLSTEKSHKYLRVETRPLVSPSTGKTLGGLTVIRDITLEKELDKMKEEFLHYITHDLRNPLGSAMGFIEVLLKGVVGDLSPEQHNMVSSIQRSMSRLMSMINNILDIAKMESGRIKLQLQKVSVAGIAARSMGIIESLSKQKKIEVKLEAAEECTIDGDGDLLERVFTNLLGNAIKYTPSGGRITIHVTDDGSRYKAVVEDSGDGIPESYRSRIFDKFEQVTGQRKGGTGLGLTISKFFVEAHGGKIWVEPAPEKGSRFCFTLAKHLSVGGEGKP